MVMAFGSLEDLRRKVISDLVDLDVWPVENAYRVGNGSFAAYGAIAPA
jgi:hypothetical protein